MGSALVENGVMRILRELDHNKSIVCLSITARNLLLAGGP
jgi:hypothetical protein